MDQVKIGLLIKECRKSKNLTQSELANKLYVSPKTISKWECGNGTPDVSLMKPLCDELGLTLNELLSGEKISQEDYQITAEDKLLILKKIEAKDNRTKKYLQWVLLLIGVIFMAVSIVIVIFSSIEKIYAIILAITGALTFIANWLVSLILELDRGYYECPNCREKIVPRFSNLLFKPEFMSYRKIRCPHCQKINYCKHIY